MKKHIANCFTLLNLFFGCLAVINILHGFGKYGMGGEPKIEDMYWASLFMCCAALVDFLDGLIARLLNAASELGKQMDSLADLVSFGVAPGLIVFQFLKLNCANHFPEFSQSYWFLLPALLLPCAGAFRLARFNISTSKTFHFEGMPIPVTGLLMASFPLIYRENECAFVQNLMQNMWFWYALVFLLSYLMVSKIPMMGMKFKQLSLKNNWHQLLLILLAIIFGISLHWLAVPLMFIVYVLFSLVLLKNEANKL